MVLTEGPRFRTTEVMMRSISSDTSPADTNPVIPGICLSDIPYTNTPPEKLTRPMSCLNLGRMRDQPVIASTMRRRFGGGDRSALSSSETVVATCARSLMWFEITKRSTFASSSLGQYSSTSFLGRIDYLHYSPILLLCILGSWRMQHALSVYAHFPEVPRSSNHLSFKPLVPSYPTAVRLQQ